MAGYDGRDRFRWLHQNRAAIKHRRDGRCIVSFGPTHSFEGADLIEATTIGMIEVPLRAEAKGEARSGTRAKPTAGTRPTATARPKARTKTKGRAKSAALSGSSRG